MGQNCFKCDCHELSHGPSELDFSVFDTDVVQIASYDNEGYYKIREAFEADKQIISAVVRTAEVAEEVTENDNAAFQDDGGGYEYISVKRVSSSDTKVARATGKSTCLQNTGITDHGVIKETSTGERKVRNAKSFNETNVQNGGSNASFTQNKLQRPKSYDSGKPMLVRDTSHVRPPPQPPRPSHSDKSLSCTERKRRSSGCATPPLPPRKFGNKKVAHHSSKTSIKSADFRQRKSLSNRARYKSESSASSSLKSQKQTLGSTEMFDISKAMSDSTATVYWEIGDVLDEGGATGSRNSSLRQSIGERKVVAGIDFGTAYSCWGYSLRDDFLSDPADITVKYWSSDSVSSSKAPTCVLLSPDGNRVEAFGYEAQKRFCTLIREGRHKQYYFFNRFKMELHRFIHKVRGIKSDFELADFSGKLLPATKVFGLCIGWFKDDLMAHLRSHHAERFENGDIHWILAIPAVWSRTTKQFMRDAAKQAAIFSRHLSIICEPEAVSLICHHEAGKVVGVDLVKASAQYIVVDAAGGTVDLQAIEIDGNNCPKIISSAYISNLGGINVDTAFEKLLKDILGAHVFNRFVESDYDDYMELMHNFETAKRSVTVDAEEDVIFTVPRSLVDIYHRRTAKRLDSNRVIKHLNMCFSENKLHCNALLFKELFKDTCNDIVRHINQLLEKDKVSCATAIIMTGGFSQCSILQEIVTEAFPFLKVLVLNDAPLSVLKGAIMHGHMQET